MHLKRRGWTMTPLEFRPSNVFETRNGWKCVGRSRGSIIFLLIIQDKNNPERFRPQKDILISIPERLGTEMRIRTVVGENNNGRSRWKCDGCGEDGMYMNFHIFKEDTTKKPSPRDTVIVVKGDIYYSWSVKCTPDTEAEKIDYEPEESN